ncbi:hypothetical protein [Haloquadratum walsbyi]|uniref:Uncharacterized protein n=1 Tax=Haloquadratum walsbyi J07HQW2 TaxID=1238425 RepID=U1NEW0_9EURY|nr:hypothetical protein [Haloquadratum walsbyi]ERG95308.1 MAG: hypothetical protein J07HQW2_01762 [Haloquadratum walsbyi J07HQW2]
MDERLKSFLRKQFREAGREYARARDAYQSGQKCAETEDNTDSVTNGQENQNEATSEQEEMDTLRVRHRHTHPSSVFACDDTGQVRIVCRRAAEKRSVTVDSEARPSCFESGHPDCEGCVRDIRDGIVETW